MNEPRCTLCNNTGFVYGGERGEVMEICDCPHGAQFKRPDAIIPLPPGVKMSDLPHRINVISTPGMGTGKFLEMWKAMGANRKPEDPARRTCPTCGTPAMCHPDRIRGEDAISTPADVVKVGADMLEKLLKTERRETVEMIADAVFKSMMEQASK